MVEEMRAKAREHNELAAKAQTEASRTWGTYQGLKDTAESHRKAAAAFTRAADEIEAAFKR